MDNMRDLYDSLDDDQKILKLRALVSGATDDESSTDHSGDEAKIPYYLGEENVSQDGINELI